MLLKRILACTLALSFVLPLVACGKDDSSVESQSDKVTVSLPPVDDTSDGEGDSNPLKVLGDDVQKEIVWMSDSDLNPAADGERSVALTLFEDYCGGKIVYRQTAWDKRFDDLAAAVLGGSAPDIFPYHWIAFPGQLIQDIYQPVDPIVDFDDPLWAGVKSTADQYIFDGDHYLAPLAFNASATMLYNKDFIDEIGADDPYELYMNGEWNWDTWRGIMEEWVASGTEEDPRYGFNGYFAPQIIQSTGKTLVNYENGVFTNNLNDPDIERAETFLYNLAKDGLYREGWIGGGRDAFKQNIIFYSMGDWAYTGTSAGPKEDENWGLVPIPADPNADGKFTTGDLVAHMWVKGSTATEAVQAWYNCNRIAYTDETYSATDREKFFSQNPYWTEEMYQVKRDVVSDEYQLLFEYGYGVSMNLGDDQTAPDGQCVINKLYNKVLTIDGEAGTQYTWAQVRDEYSAVVDSELAFLNDALANLG